LKTTLPDGRVFETLPFIQIDYDPLEPVYKFAFITSDRKVRSSARHLWAVWDKKARDVSMIRMDAIDIDNHELLVQGWE
jgi:hypothetical protein